MNNEKTRQFKVYIGDNAVPFTPKRQIINGDTKVSSDGLGKEAFFASGGEGWKAGFVDKDEVMRWKKELALCDCYRCFDEDCIAREKNIRFPEDVGGRAQCLRLAQSKSEFAFRNSDGTVISIPDGIVEKIIEKIRGNDK